MFPPFITTIQGAIRTSLALEQQWRPGETVKWPKELGGPDDLGNLQLRGPYLLYGDEPYFPAPLLLLGKEGIYIRLVPGEPVECDLGSVRLPVPAQEPEGAKLLNGVYLTREGLGQVLEGVVPSQNTLKKHEFLCR